MGVFVSDIITPTTKLVLTLSARADRWRNYDGHNLETSVATGLPTANYRDDLPERTDTVFSPRVAAARRHECRLIPRKTALCGTSTPAGAW